MLCAFSSLLTQSLHRGMKELYKWLEITATMGGLQANCSRSIISSSRLIQWHWPEGSSPPSAAACGRSFSRCPRASAQAWRSHLQADIHHGQGHLPAPAQPHRDSPDSTWHSAAKVQRLGQRRRSGNLSPFCHNVYQACRLANCKEHHAVLVGPVAHRVNRIGKGTWQTSHPLPLPSRKKTPKLLYPIDGHQILTFRSLWTMPFRWQWLTLSRICCIQWLQRYKGRMEGRTF